MNFMTCMMIVVFARKVVRLQYNYKIYLNAKFLSQVTTRSSYSACRTVRRKLFGRNTLIDWIKRLPNAQYAIKMCQLKLVILAI